MLTMLGPFVKTIACLQKHDRHNPKIVADGREKGIVPRGLHPLSQSMSRDGRDKS